MLLINLELFLLRPTPVPDVKQLQVLLQFELVDFFAESYVQENVLQVFSGVEIQTERWPWCRCTGDGGTSYRS